MDQTKRCPYCSEEILATAQKCKHCGEWLNVETQKVEKKMINCPICGELIEEGIKQCPHCKENVSSAKSVAKVTPVVPADEPRSFFDYYLIEPFFRQYLTFKGRLNRKHYWVSMLVWFLIFAELFTLFWYHFFVWILYDIWIIASIIPLYATTTRRLRDVDSDPSIFAWFFLLTGSPFLLFWTCKKPEDESSRTDGLKPDIPQSVKFKLSDKIITLILVLLFVFGTNGPMWIDEDNMNEGENDLEDTTIIIHNPTLFDE